MVHHGCICRPRQLPDPEICPLSELELAMDCGPDHKANRRLNAIHLLLIGVSFEHVVRHSCRTERCVRLWVARYNEMGIDGLIYRPRSGRPRLLDGDTIRSEILPVVDDPSKAQQLHWTAVKLTGWLRAEKGFEISYRTVVRYPTALWLEGRVALDVDHEAGGRLKRGIPLPLAEISGRLAADSGGAPETCAKHLQSLLLWISEINLGLVKSGERYTILPFRLHQFFAQTGSVYATLGTPGGRFITLEPGVHHSDQAGGVESLIP